MAPSLLMAVREALEPGGGLATRKARCRRKIAQADKHFRNIPGVGDSKSFFRPPYTDEPREMRV